MKAEITEEMMIKNDPLPEAPEEAEETLEIVPPEASEDVSGNVVPFTVTVDPDGQVLTYLDAIYELFDEQREATDALVLDVKEINDRYQEQTEATIFDKPLSSYTVEEGLALVSLVFLLCLVVWKVFEFVQWRR